MAPTARGSPSRRATGPGGRSWPGRIPMRWRGRPTSTPTGRSWIPRSGCATATPACGWIRAGPAVRQATSATTTRASSATCPCASRGRRGSPGGAGLRPPHLAAICVWEGWADNYRDGNRHGGIICVFRKNWQDMQVKTVQHGVGTRGAKSRITGELVCGPETLTEEELEKNRENLWQSVLSRPLDGPYYHERTGDLSKVTVPLLSAANWGGQGLHPRGNFEGYMRAASKDKWLEVHGGSHWAPFYTDYGVKLQKRFFDYFLKGSANGWGPQPRVVLQGGHPGAKFVQRHE